jgi:hypothetical protein
MAFRSGRIFVTAGDLISELDFTAASGTSQADTGQTLLLPKGSDVHITIRFRVPESTNAHGDSPKVSRVDLITGDVSGPTPNRNGDKNETTKVFARFSEKDWTRSGNSYSLKLALPKIDRNIYLRVRGTNTTEPEPMMDAKGESPWEDLWFYSNPIFVEVR